LRCLNRCRIKDSTGYLYVLFPCFSLFSFQGPNLFQRNYTNSNHQTFRLALLLAEPRRSEKLSTPGIWKGQQHIFKKMHSRRKITQASAFDDGLAGRFGGLLA